MKITTFSLGLALAVSFALTGKAQAENHSSQNSLCDVTKQDFELYEKDCFKNGNGKTLLECLNKYKFEVIAERNKIWAELANAKGSKADQLREQEVQATSTLVILDVHAECERLRLSQ